MSDGNFDSTSFDGSAGGFDVDPSGTFGRSGLGGDDVPRPYRKSPHPGWNKAEWKRRVKDEQDAVEATLREAYAALTGADAPISVLAQVDRIVRPVAKRPAPEAPQLRINWSALALDFKRANALIRIWREEAEMRAIEDDDEEIIMMAFQ